MKIVIGDKKPRNVHGVAKLCNPNLDRVQMAFLTVWCCSGFCNIGGSESGKKRTVISKRNEKEEGEEA